jgi:hypothetical protein
MTTTGAFDQQEWAVALNIQASRQQRHNRLEGSDRRSTALRKSGSWMSSAKCRIS